MPKELTEALWRAAVSPAVEVADVGRPLTDPLLADVRRELPVVVGGAFLRCGEAEAPALSVSHARSRLAEGWTLYVEGADRRMPSLRELRLAIARRFGYPFTRITLYVAAPGAPAARPAHVDPGPAAVVQLGGAKAWSVGEDHDLVLEAGQVLVLPAGTVHATRGAVGDDVSVHATLTVMQPSLPAVARAVERAGWVFRPDVFASATVGGPARIDYLASTLTGLLGDGGAQQVMALCAAVDEQVDSIDLLLSPSEVRGAVLRRGTTPLYLEESVLLVADQILSLASAEAVELAATVARAAPAAAVLRPGELDQLCEETRLLAFALCQCAALEVDHSVADDGTHDDDLQLFGVGKEA